MAPSKLKSKRRDQDGANDMGPKSKKAKLMVGGLRIALKPSTLCICGGTDESTPMIGCDVCKKWYHFDCLNLSNRDAEDIAVYVCADCERATGLSLIMNWDWSESLGVVNAIAAAGQNGTSDDSMGDSDTSQDLDADIEFSASSDAESSEDYVTDAKSRAKDILGRPMAKEKLGGRRMRVRAPIYQSPSMDSSPENSIASPTAASKPSTSLAAKTKLEDPGPAADDPVRKYCLGKLLEVIAPIFQEHKPPRDQQQLPDTSRSREAVQDPIDGPVQIKTDPEASQDTAAAFVEELELYLFEYHSEIDERKGKRVAAGKYREKFRTLTFNLAQKDRVALRRRIATHSLSAKELSRMSSADLANEQRQQEIERARRESLQHSILQVRAVPTAKITHKGEEIIEAVADTYGFRRQPGTERDGFTDRDFLSREPETSPIMTVLPEADSSESTIGMHLEGRVVSSECVHGDRSSPIATLSVPSPATRDPVAETVNYTEEVSSPLLSPQNLEHLASSMPSSANCSINPRSALTSAINPGPRFDLNSLWSREGGRNGQGDRRPSVLGLTAEPESDAQVINVEPNNDSTAQDLLDDRDFDQFLNADVDVEEAPHGRHADGMTYSDILAFLSLPLVWSGQLIMPMDPAPPLVCSVSARQVGGPDLGISPSVWDLLLTSSRFRIEGRVSVETSNQYLLTMRMTTTKELVIVAALPTEESERGSFDALFEFLYSRSRCGVLLPWGPKPPDSAPGKDLYLVPLKPSDSLPEYVQLLDQGRVRAEVAGRTSLASLPPSSLPHLPSQVIPSFSPPAPLRPSPLHMGPNVLATLSSDLASLTPDQLRLVQGLLASNRRSTEPGIGLESTPGPSLSPAQSAAILPATLTSTGFSQPYSLPHFAAQSPLAGTVIASYPSPPLMTRLPSHSGPSVHALRTAQSPLGMHDPYEYEMTQAHSRGGGTEIPRGRSFDRPRDTGWSGRGRGRHHAR